MTGYPEIKFCVGYATLKQEFFVLQHISLNPPVSGDLGFNLLNSVLLFRGFSVKEEGNRTDGVKT